MKYIYLILLSALPFCGQLSAQQVAGADDPQFVAATESWLQGEDLTALQALGALAREGNIAAKILLSRIADTPHFSDHITAELSRPERKELLREPTGLSGRDWLSSAAEESALARALWEVQSSSLEAPDFETIVPTLISYGEEKAVFDYMLEMWRFGENDFAARILAENEEMFGPAGQNFLGFILATMAMQGQSVPVPNSVTTQEQFETYVQWLRSDTNRFAGSGVLPVAGNRFADPGNPQDRLRLTQIARALDELQPLRLHCETACSIEHQDTCLAYGAHAVSFGANFPFPFASPAQSLIDDPTYWASPRFAADLERILTRGQWQGCH